MRYVLKKGNEYIKWIQWTAGAIPTVRTAGFEKSMIIDDEYLDYTIDKAGKTRRELILEYHPDVEILKVEVHITE